MTRLHATDVRCEALFASALQRSDAVTAEAAADAITQAICRFGSAGCVAAMAQEFGDHPETACQRMRWVRQVIGELDLMAELELLAELDVVAERDLVGEPTAAVPNSAPATC